MVLLDVGHGLVWQCCEDVQCLFLVVVKLVAWQILGYVFLDSDCCQIFTCYLDKMWLEWNFIAFFHDIYFFILYFPPGFFFFFFLVDESEIYPFGYRISVFLSKIAYTWCMYVLRMSFVWFSCILFWWIYPLNISPSGQNFSSARSGYAFMSSLCIVMPHYISTRLLPFLSLSRASFHNIFIVVFCQFVKPWFLMLQETVVMEHSPMTLDTMGQLYQECISDRKSRFWQIDNQSVPRAELICPQPRRATRVPCFMDNINRIGPKPKRWVMAIKTVSQDLKLLPILSLSNSKLSYGSCAWLQMPFSCHVILHGLFFVSMQFASEVPKACIIE